MPPGGSCEAGGGHIDVDLWWWAGGSFPDCLDNGVEAVIMNHPMIAI